MMNRVVSRAKALLLLVLLLVGGMAFFLGEYFAKSQDWILFAGSPHVYNTSNLGCGIITDRNGMLLLDLSGEKTYSSAAELRKSTLHWIGDRQGNISTPALSHYAKEIAGFDPITGIYNYSGNGGQVTLSLSGKIQTVALEAMGDYKGTLAVYNYETGELLCAISTPTFDPEEVPDISGDTTGQYDGVYVNRFVQSAYTPGSIFKIVTAAAALETITDIQEQTFTCNGVAEYGVDKVTCEQSHGTLTFQEAFGRSCNCAFASIADQLGGEVLERYAAQFGITESLSFDGIITARGSMEAKDAPAVQVAWSAIGQHKNLINPCTFLTFLGAIANDGVGIKPYLVSQITVGDKTTYTAEKETTGRIMSKETAAVMQSFLRNNVQTYYGDDSIPGLTVCAKSGTAEVGGDKRPNAMFTGFVMDEEYPLAFIAAIEDGGYGRQICVPILAQVLTACKAEIDGVNP